MTAVRVWNVAATSSLHIRSRYRIRYRVSLSVSPEWPGSMCRQGVSRTHSFGKMLNSPRLLLPG